ncbi:MAG: hypothetical protein L0332_17675 [Chloroflexi bacterium]|nr:hypothetical protein [Chloroflexota bacterium]MCI0578712.1 hypothetical protein [Chloroflexota bacterium]MCI0648651.1 hypothetical protein [Chloroflexota bacterium]MCI0728531.1 hypothetical protein [Chloroflexota bacterium]
MRQVAAQKQPSFPGVIATLSAGFELVAGHWWLVLLPVLLDLFFWLGPRLSILALAERNATILRDAGLWTAELTEQVVQLATRENFFTTLSIPLIGIPALLKGPVPAETPLAPPVLEVHNALLWLVLFVGLSLAGLALATTYLSLIAQAIRAHGRQARLNLRRFVQMLAVNGLRLFGLGLAFLFFLFLVYIPLLPVALFAGLFDAGVALAVLTMGFVLVAVYLSLAVPGIILDGRPLVRAMLDSVRLVQRHMVPTVFLFLLVSVISSGLNSLWLLADDGSWLLLAGIFGHAFVSTALAATVFVFYRDRAASLAGDSEQATESR